MRPRIRLWISCATAIVLAIALVWHYRWLGGPFFVFPQTVQDHVWPVPFASRDVIVLAGRASEILPRGATVTAIQPSLAPNYDVTHFLTAAGMMPHHRVVPPKLDATADLPRYVLAVRDELSHPAYRLLSSWPEGRIYEVRR